MILVVIGVVLIFSFVVFFGAPYLPTLKPQKKAALDLLDLKRGQTLLELGCGDGRVLRAAARRGINVVGYELNPILFAFSYLTTLKYRDRVTVKWRDYWREDWPKADGVYVFLLDKYMEKLDRKIKSQDPRPKKLVSFAWQIPGRQPDKEKNGVFLYKY